MRVARGGYPRMDSPTVCSKKHLHAFDLRTCTPLAIFSLQSIKSGPWKFWPLIVGVLLCFVVGSGSLWGQANVSPKDAPDKPAGFPVAVRVAADHTYLRAGPSNDFYPTERLLVGQRLEIWAVDPSGYCAVRPVDGSFSWVRAADVDDAEAVDSNIELHADSKADSQGHAQVHPQASPVAGPRRSIGVIVADGAVARVGSQINSLRHVAQVRLEAGERVRVIDEVRSNEERHAGLWVRIEPPPGEFRWARMADLDMPPGLAPVMAPANEGDASDGTTPAEALAAIKSAGDAIALAVNEAREMDSAPELLEDSGAGESGVPQTLNPLPAARRLLSGWLPMGAGVFNATSRPAAVAIDDGAVAASGDELADIDLSLSLAVAGPPESWNLPQLRERLRLASARSNAQSERTRAEAIDTRLSRFEAIQTRQQALAINAPVDPSPLRLGSMWSSLSGIGSRPIRPGVFPGGAPADGKTTWTPPEMSETTGRLATVVSRRPDAPRWALVDANNTVLVFVTPQAGVNLAPLVGQQVSVRGTKGFMPEYKRPYLVASEARTRVATAPIVSTDTTR